MSKDAVSQWSTTAADNTDVGGISLAENVMLPSFVNNAFREVMEQIAVARASNDLTSVPYGVATASTAAYLEFKEDTDNGTNKVTLIAPASIASDKTATFQDITGTLYITGGQDVSVADGGTGLSTLTANNVILGNGASAPTFVAPGASGNVLTSNGTTWTSAAAAGGFTAATQAEQEAGSSTTVGTTPGTQHFHPSASKFWVKAGITANILASYNVTSLTDTGTGQVTVTIATDFSSANWCGFATLLQTGGIAAGTGSAVAVFTAQAAGTCTVEANDLDGDPGDPDNYFIGGFGDFA